MRVSPLPLAGEVAVSAAGDIIIYRKADDKSLLGRVTSADPATHELTIERNNEPPESVPLNNVVGRVILNSR